MKGVKLKTPKSCSNCDFHIFYESLYSYKENCVLVKEGKIKLEGKQCTLKTVCDCWKEQITNRDKYGNEIK